MELEKAILSVSGVLFGFFFAGFWWSLNRELEFEPGSRHFKPSYALLLLSMGLLAYFGIVKPLESLTINRPSLAWSCRGVVLAIIGILGYMTTELGHYDVFQLPKYTTRIERIVFAVTLIGMVALAIVWLA